MERITLALASVVRRHPLALIVLTMCAATGLSFGLPRLEFRTGQDTLLDPGSKIARDNARYQEQFGGDPILVLFEVPEADATTTIDALFSPANRNSLQRLEDELLATGDYHTVLTPLTILEYARQRVAQRMIDEPLKLARDQDAAAAVARAATAQRGASPAEQDAAAEDARQAVADAFNAEFGADAARFLAAGEQSLDNPAFVRFLIYADDAGTTIRPELEGIFPDPRHALMVVRMKGNLSIDEGSAAAGDAKEITERYSFTGLDARVSGPPLLIKEINDSMRQALVLMAGFAVAIMVLVLWTIFRARWRLLSLPAVLVGCIAAFGLMGFVGIPLTMVTISGLPILIGLGVDFAIQVHSRIEEETAATDNASAAIDRVALRLGPALALAALAACLGFLVLRLSDVPMIRDFGAMLAVGAVIVFVTSITLVSSIVFLRERLRLGDAAHSRGRFEIERLVGGITSRTVGRFAPIALGGVVVALAGLYVGGRIPTETDPEKFVPSGSEVLAELHHVRDVSGSTSELSLLIETAPGTRVDDDAVLAWMYAFEQRQRQAHAELQRSNSLASFVASATGEEPTTERASAVVAAAPDALTGMVVSGDGRTASITFALTGDDTLTERKVITDAILADANPPAGVTVAPAGIAVVGTATVEAISANRDTMSLVAIGSILVLLAIAFRNPVKAIAPMLPVVLALGASSALLYAAGISYSPLTSISGPLIIAMGTEFNILLMSRYFEERRRGSTPREAMSRASLKIGRAIAASGLTVMGGFAVLAFSNFPLLDNFGRVTALNIGLSLISTLILLPPLLVWADEDRGLVPVDGQPMPG